MLDIKEVSRVLSRKGRRYLSAIQERNGDNLCLTIHPELILSFSTQWRYLRSSSHNATLCLIDFNLNFTFSESTKKLANI